MALTNNHLRVFESYSQVFFEHEVYTVMISRNNGTRFTISMEKVRCMVEFVAGHRRRLNKKHHVLSSDSLEVLF